MRPRTSGVAGTLVVLGVWIAASAPGAAQQGAPGGEWRAHAGESGGTKYSPLDQINERNVQDLRVAWRWKSVDYDVPRKDPTTRFNHTLTATPLMIGGRLYMSTNRGQSVAIDPITGKTLWVYQALADGAGREEGAMTRGVAYWQDPARPTDERIVQMSGNHLVALNAKNGEPVSDFGEGGKIDLRVGMPRIDTYRWNGPPLVCRDTIIVSMGLIAQTEPVPPPSYLRGFDARTGRLKWQFNPIPQAGEFGNETWENESWKNTGKTYTWSMMSADQDLGYAYVPTATPTNDWYGGHRLGDNLFAESLLCLECATGRRVWHFQMVHHGLWDYDIPAAPVLADLTVGGQPIKAVAQVTKHGFVFVFDRVTGKPVWPIEERPVPPSDVPGERAAATQPFPTKPPPYERQGITPDDLIDLTPELRAEAVEIMKRYRYGPLFTPPSVRDEGPGGTLGTLQLPAHVGGSDWNGAAFDPETKILYVPSITTAIAVGLRKGNPATTRFNYARGPWNVFIPGPQGLPLVKPPWGRITAIDLNKGEHLWVVPNAPGPRDHIALQGVALPWLGNNGRPTPLLTKTLLFLGEGSNSLVAQPPLAGGNMFRAFDKRTGKALWQVELAAGTSGAPMTYLAANGKQYIVVAVSDLEHEGELVAFTLQ